MRGGFVEELRRTAGLRLTLVLAGLLVLTAVASTWAGPSPVSTPAIATVYYYEGGAYHLVTYVYSADGAPMGGATVHFGSPQPLPPGSTVQATTNSAGVAIGTFPAVPGNYTFTATTSTTSGSATAPTEVTNWPHDPSNGTVVDGFGDVTPVRTGTYAPSGSLLAFFSGPNGTAPVGYKLQYVYVTFSLDRPGPVHPVHGTGQFSVPPGWVNRFPLANMTTYSAVASFQVPSAPSGFGPSILAQVVAPNGSVVADAILPPTDFGPQPTTTPATQGAELLLTEVGLVTLLTGVLGGLALYGTDRLSGALEPYLARPVTPPGFLAARYLGLLAVLSVGVVLGLLLADGEMAVRYGSAMPGAMLAVAVAAGVASAAAWLGVPFALAHFARAPVRLMTLTMALVVVFGFLWAPSLSAIGPWVGAGPGTPGAGTLSFDGQVVDPALAPSALIVPSLTGLGTLTVVGVVVALAGWIAGPIALALERARRGD